MHLYKPPDAPPTVPPTLLRSYWPRGRTPDSASLAGAARACGDDVHVIFGAGLAPNAEPGERPDARVVAFRAGAREPWQLAPGVAPVRPTEASVESNVKGVAKVIIDPSQLPLEKGDSRDDSAAHLSVRVAELLAASHPRVTVDFFVDSNPRGRAVRVTGFVLDSQSYGLEARAAFGDLESQARAEFEEGASAAVAAALASPGWRVPLATADAPPPELAVCRGKNCPS